MLPVEILPVQETIVLRARGSELLIMPHHVKQLKSLEKPKDFSQYFRDEALVNRPARKLFESWLRKDQTLWPRLYQTVHKEMTLGATDGEAAAGEDKPSKKEAAPAASKPAKAPKAEAEKPAKQEKSSKEVKPAKADKVAKTEKPAKDEKPAKTEKAAKTEKPAKADKADKAPKAKSESKEKAASKTAGASKGKTAAKKKG